MGDVDARVHIFTVITLKEEWWLALSYTVVYVRDIGVPIT